MKSLLTWRFWLVPAVYIFGMFIGVLGAYIKMPVFEPDPQMLPAREIIMHNMTVLFIMLVGSLSIGIVTLYVIFINGAVLGAFLQIFSVQGLLLNVIIALLPHGVFEISAYIIAGIADMFLVSCLIQLIRNYREFDFKILRRGLLGNLLAAVLIVIGGYIESTIFLWS